MFANQFEIKTDAVNERILILSNLWFQIPGKLMR